MKHLPRSLSICKTILATTLAFALIACGGGTDSAVTVGQTPPPGPSASQNLAISGKLVAPNGSTPIANALVYVEGSSAATAQSLKIVSTTDVSAAIGVQDCGIAPNAAWPATCSAADGGFSLNIKTQTSLKLVAVKGAFKVEQTLTAGTSNNLVLGSISIGANVSAGAPRMAVVTGDFDSIENILAKLGYGEVDVATGQLKPGTEKFKIYSGTGSTTSPAISALFLDADSNGKADIFNYDIVFFNCGLDESFVNTVANRAILRAYVQGGGRIYASDWSYDIVEQVFPEYIDFYGSDATLASSPEEVNAAEQGLADITTNVNVDPGLLAWLRGVSCAGGSCVRPDDTVHIEGFLGGWAVINGAHAGQTGVRTWASGPVQFGSNAAAVNKPLTMSLSVGAGRVTYTSYHNEASVSGELQPQQRILQYLVFEL